MEWLGVALRRVGVAEDEKDGVFDAVAEGYETVTASVGVTNCDRVTLVEATLVRLEETVGVGKPNVAVRDGNSVVDAVRSSVPVLELRRRRVAENWLTVTLIVAEPRVGVRRCVGRETVAVSVTERVTEAALVTDDDRV